MLFMNKWKTEEGNGLTLFGLFSRLLICKMQYTVNVKELY